MKMRIIIIALFAIEALNVNAQSDYSSYLNQAWKSVNSGECDAAQRNYNVYKDLSGNRSTQLEDAILNCKQAKYTHAKYIPQGYVDLALPSGTLWKARNEEGFYTHTEAINKFGSQLPTSSQFDELVENCEWEWYGAGYRVTGKNGNYIIIQALGSRTKNKGTATEVGTRGTYWTSESWRTAHEDAVVFGISNSYSAGYFCYRHSKSHGFSVILVHNN